MGQERKSPEEFEVPITEHLAELRIRLFRSLIAVVIANDRCLYAGLNFSLRFSSNR
ncbi:MAG: hypothetical protein Q9M89_03510 [Persephonella sp.]|nr:hypothetical protein [Persephonella sp.]